MHFNRFLQDLATEFWLIFHPSQPIHVVAFHHLIFGLGVMYILLYFFFNILFLFTEL